MEKIVLMGGGKFAGLLYSQFKHQYEFVGYLDDIYEKAYIEETYNLKKLGTSGDAKKILNYCPNIVIAIGVEKDVSIRKKYFELFERVGFEFPKLIHEKAQIYTDLENINKGVIIQPNAIVDPQVVIGENTVVSRLSIIGHDSKIGNNSYIAPGVIINGSVTIGNECFIGTGGIVIQKVKVGDKVIVGAGACVIKDILNNQIVVGVPAKEKKIRISSDN